MKLKNFFKNTKYLWIGGLMGAAQQLLGRLDYYLYHGRDIFSFSNIMGSLSLYAAIILFVIKRDVPPKQQFRDLFLFFLGLDFFYYLYIFIMELCWYLSEKKNSAVNLGDISYYFQETHDEIFDFIKWTTIGTAAAIWAYFATKLRNNNKKRAYIAMLIPLFAVIVLELADDIHSLIMYIIQEYKRAHDLPLPVGSEWFCPTSSIVTSLVLLILCSYKFIFAKEASDKRRNTDLTK
ncbi:hypothetical protein [Ruminococcus flavefaciens]|uniref:hypothetical protein n=1 Tax=Ruminococcus flavefaciens TaxID=1265 RepID=UPI0026F28CB7|nr:hypothetical protein [Ruminococcus flavefaciens]MDD7515119.1 hypothetical protein [Ruminococcus flavefaciens]MDY5692616.1 hypothetical protein [Ruminococcus flavefaciens]